jgi:hypothetical protein
MIRLRKLPNAAVCVATVAISTHVTIASAQNAPVTVSINATQNRRPINPNIYGVAYGDQTSLTDLNIPVNRLGGNNTSRYNWKLNADNRGSDWYFESIGDTSAVAGERGDTFISASKLANAQAMLTIPMIDWIANLGANRSKLASFLVSKYGAQKAVDPYWTVAGNGILSSGATITGNNPADANVPNNVAFETDWVSALVARWGTAANGGLRYYILDNEPGIWHSTHRDVHPNGVTMDELRSKTIGYASAIKSLDPTALVVGPEEWGWTNYLYSGSDSQYGSIHGWNYLPDRAAHGNADMMPWLLDQLHQYDVANGKRLLDVFSLHYYPQGGEFGGGTDTTTQLLRNRSTRSLWDPTYVDQSWIGSVVQLIPRMRNWVNTYYPGTQIGITEYNWGADGHINGATAQADIWGIFGREGLDLAARWAMPGTNSITYNAMKMYRNYDGRKSTFGDTSVSAAVPNPDNLSAFAATRSTDGALTVMVISKVLSGDTPVTLNVAGFTGNGSTQVWQLTAANMITRKSDLSVSNNTLSATVPSQSITLFVLPSTGTAPPPVGAPTNLTAKGWNGRVPLSWSAGASNISFAVKRSTTAGGPYTTITSGLTTTSYIDTGVTNGTRYFYVVEATGPAGDKATSNEASAVPVKGASAALLATDTTTKGTWKGVYGKDGYAISQLAQSLPAYAQFSVASAGNYTWVPSTTDTRGLQKVSTADRIAGAWYTNASMTVNLNLTDGKAHNVAMYMVDWDSTTRVEWFQFFDASTGEPIVSQASSGFNGGKWLVWSIQGNVQIVVTRTAGANAVLSGLMFDAGAQPAPPAPTNLAATAGNGQVSLSWTASTGATGYTVKRSTTAGGPYTAAAPGVTTTTYTDTGLTNGTKYFYVVTASSANGESGNSNEASATPTAPQSGNSAVFLNLDTTTHGSWKGAYGTEGYSIAQLSGGTILPAYAQWSVTGNSNWTWGSSTTDVRALQKVATSDRIAAAWYGSTFTGALNLTDGQAHQVALYVLDWDTTARAETVDVLDATTGAVLNSQTVSGFNGGKWLVWSVSGSVKFRVTRTGGTNAVLSGVFFK